MALEAAAASATMSMLMMAGSGINQYPVLTTNQDESKRNNKAVSTAAKSQMDRIK